MRTLTRSLSSALSLIAAIAFASSGCVFVHDQDPPPSNAPGDISFLWSFDGESRCSQAGVSEVDVQVVTPGGELVFGDTVACAGGGLTLTDFAPGSYELWIDAFSAGGAHLYTGEAPVTVQGGVVNDIGTVELAPTARTGSLGLYWSFLYPTDDSVVTDCATAGVEEVDLEVVPLDGQGDSYVETFACGDEGVLVEGLAEGRYRVSLLAFGRYQNMDLALYERELEAEVVAGDATDLGDVNLSRIFESFADIEVTWELGGGSCAALGVTDVEFSIRRVGSGIEDDHFTVECDRTFALRQTFVPGSYLVEASAMGTSGSYTGATTLDIAPNSTAPAHVTLVLAN